MGLKDVVREPQSSPRRLEGLAKQPADLAAESRDDGGLGRSVALLVEPGDRLIGVVSIRLAASAPCMPARSNPPALSGTRRSTYSGSNQANWAPRWAFSKLDWPVAKCWASSRVATIVSADPGRAAISA